jgi:patatin-like phospholipase/acyl hydrolase
MAGRFKVLSLDGGGIRGIIPARILTTIEDKTNRSIADMFDLIAGTSTGGILAAGLAGSKGGNKPIRTAAELLNMYVDRGAEIFSRSLWKGITSVGGLRDERYSAGPLERVLKDTLGDAELKDVITNVLIPSYDIEGRGDYRGGGPYFFKSSKASTDQDYNYYLRDVARATSAAPTYFEPAHIENRSGAKWTALVDGGVFANNPAACVRSFWSP